MYDAEVGCTNVEYNANLTSQGIYHRTTRMVAHPDINHTQQDLTSVMKWEQVFSLGQAVYRFILYTVFLSFMFENYSLRVCVMVIMKHLY